MLRGRRGTEYTINSHTNTDTFIMLTSTTVFPASLVSGELYVKRTYGFGHTGANSTTKFTPNGRGRKSYSPCHAKAKVDSNNNTTITWIRRTRFGGGWLNRIDSPLNETSEAYEVVVMNGTVEVRSIFTSSPIVSYTADMQKADFGSIQETLTIIIYQLSSVVGRGYSATVTINNTHSKYVVTIGDASGDGGVDSVRDNWGGSSDSGEGDGNGDGGGAAGGDGDSDSGGEGDGDSGDSGDAGSDDGDGDCEGGEL